MDLREEEFGGDFYFSETSGFHRRKILEWRLGVDAKGGVWRLME
jgi:hypothetical protein